MKKAINVVIGSDKETEIIIVRGTYDDALHDFQSLKLTETERLPSTGVLLGATKTQVFQLGSSKVMPIPMLEILSTKFRREALRSLQCKYCKRTRKLLYVVKKPGPEHMQMIKEMRRKQK